MAAGYVIQLPHLTTPEGTDEPFGVGLGSGGGDPLRISGQHFVDPLIDRVLAKRPRSLDHFIEPDPEAYVAVARLYFH